MTTSPSSGVERVICTTCAQHCGCSCLLQVHVKDGIVTRIESDNGDDPQYKACAKGRALRQHLYASERLLYPLKRVGARGEGKFERISWDEAIDTVAREWLRIRDKYGPLSCVYDHVGGDVAFIHIGTVAKLLDKLGGAYRTWGNMSFQGAHLAVLASYGTLFTNNMRDDLPNSKLIIGWGWDPAATMNGVKTQYYLAKAKEKGTRFIFIDPRYSPSAALFADRWIPIKPSTDTAMAIAMAYVMIAEDIYDHHFIETYTFGFDKYRDYVLGKIDGKPKTPAWAAEITGVPAETIIEVARLYATTKPAALMPGVGVGRTDHGEQFHHATITLAAMTGNIGIHGGDAGARAWEAHFGGYPYDNPSFLEFHTRITKRDELPYPPERASDFRKAAVHRAKLADRILDGKVKFIFFQAISYANQFPNVNKINRALQIPEFICVVEMFMSPTAKYADIILPSCSFLERNDITVGVGLPFIGAMNKVIEPLGESKTHLEIADLLAKRMGFPDLFDTNDLDIQRQYAEAARVPDIEQWRRDGVYRVKLTEPYIAFKKEIEDPKNHPFRTRSGRIEIYAQEWAELNHPDLPPVPTYLEARESWRSPLAARYPLALITPHGPTRALSKFDNVPWLRELGGQQVWINTRDAAKRGIVNGDLVKVRNDRGTLLIRAKVTGRIIQGAVSIPSGAWFKSDKDGNDIGGCANTLTADEVGAVGVYQYNTNLVEVEKYQGE
jgi:anaerobic dimethyl sulfoxide reductase subunit A